MTILEFVSNISLMAAIITGLYALLKDLLLKKMNIQIKGTIFGIITTAQLVSWAFAILMAWVANTFGLLGAGGLGIFKIVAYGLVAGGVSNGLWNINIVQNILNAITGRKE